MATLKTSDVKHVREDLANVISMISPEKTPFKTEIGKTKATSTRHEWLSDELAAANKDNAAADGAAAATPSGSGPARLGNYTQIFTKSLSVSGTLQAVNTAGTKNELSRQVTKAGSEINRDIEAAIVSANGSVASGTRKLAGAEAWIKTNALHNGAGATAGFDPVTGVVGSVTAGTGRAITDGLINEVAQNVWAAGGDPTKVIASGKVKQAISKLASGNGVWNMDASKATIYAGVDYYVSDFGRHQIIPHHFMSQSTVIFFDPSLWNLATLRSLKINDLGRVGDSDEKQMLVEVTLESLNEAGNGKIADIDVNAVVTPEEEEG